jgi:hypothetical protein
MPKFNYQWSRRLLWALVVLAARVATYVVGGYSWSFGPTLSSWLTWTIVIVLLVLTHPFERRVRQVEPSPQRRAKDPSVTTFLSGPAYLSKLERVYDEIKAYESRAGDLSRPAAARKCIHNIAGILRGDVP